jgi:hypothetical protein
LNSNAQFKKVGIYDYWERNILRNY